MRFFILVVRVSAVELPCDIRGKMVMQILADARPTHENAFKLTLVERTLGSVLAEARG